jgi:hypothetical protein
MLAVLCTSTRFLEGLWSLWSWMIHLSLHMRPVLLVDGQLTVRQRIQFERLFPNGRLLELDEYLKQCQVPDYMRRFVAANWTGKKLAAVFELQKEADVLYSDCDVTVFKKPVEIINAIDAGSSLYMFDAVGYTLDPWISLRAEKIGVQVSKHFNAGLFYVPKGEMKQSVLETVLSDWQPSFNSHHAEQTLTNLLLDSKNSSPLPEDRYVLSWQGYSVCERDLDCREMVCRHYTGPVRHRMYLSAYPFLLKQIKG